MRRACDQTLSLINDNAPDATSVDTSAGILKIAIHAVGGQGGGVLANWVSDLATRGGYTVQMTSVAGVAQRTGATIYYIEMAPKGERDPVFSLTSAPGDVDILIAAELMEAGRAVVRGFVSPDRTTLIASTHRILAVDEKVVPGDGRADSDLVLGKVKAAAFKNVCFDMEAIAARAGSMISASLFGALAKSGETPFPVTMFEDVIENSGRGVEASLAAFKGALDYSDKRPVINITLIDSDTPNTDQQEIASSEPAQPTGSPELLQQWNKLVEQVSSMPEPVQAMATVGLRKVVDYQDPAYGDEYVQHVSKFVAVDSAEYDFKLSQTAAKYIANAMCYDDIIRVADLKTRASRNHRLRNEQQASAEQIVHVTEYFHPRAQEVCGTLPAWLGGWIEHKPVLFSAVDRLVNKGRRIRTDGMTGFGMLWIASALKPRRRTLLRHRHEAVHLKRLIESALAVVGDNYSLAVEVLTCQRVVKGYSDTHSRGQSKFGLLMEGLELLKEGEGAADQLAELREIALKNETADPLELKVRALQKPAK